MLTIKHLDAGYGPVQVLWDINLAVREGEIVALIGSNGAGKTTLLTAISGLLQQPRGIGTIFFQESDITHLRADKRVARGLVHVPQGRRLFAGLTVKENLTQGAYRRRDRVKVKNDLEEVLQLFPALSSRVNSPAGKLSGGEQQMVAIGRGLMARPRLLMIDEMSLGLAPVIVDSIVRAVERINREHGMAVLIVEQDVELALRHAHRGYVIETGRIVLAADSKQLLADDHVRSAYLGV